MAIAPFKEDFFERVIDVKWETEPEVFWLVGSGSPNFINGMGSVECCVYRSSDGKHWYGTIFGQRVDSYRSFGTFLGGCWMRKGLEKGAAPIWVLCGGSSRTVATSCVGYSTDGETFGNRTVFDERHVCEDIYPQSESEITMLSLNTMGQFQHYDPYTSSDGKTWTPQNYHGGETIIGALAAPAVQTASFASRAIVVPRKPSIAMTVDTDSGPSPAPQATGFAVAEPLAEINPLATSTKKADEILFKGTATQASGRVRRGIYRGKILTVQIYPYHYPSGGGAHGDNTVRVFVQDKQAQKYAGQFKTGLYRSISVGYGHYVFVVTGSDKNGRSQLSWSENGLNWHRVDLGPYGQISGIAVGPRPTNAKPKPPRADEITNNGNTVGTGKPPVFP